jgi:colanic acid biosynthesis protein WcaH
MGTLARLPFFVFAMLMLARAGLTMQSSEHALHYRTERYTRSQRARSISLYNITMLPTAKFLQAIDATPLVAIDLIVSNENGDYLLGHRINKPAQGFWFVPGGRIRKNERLDDAFRRIAHDELGQTNLERTDADLLGVYEHLYEDNFSGEPGISTHYVVLGYTLRRPMKLENLPNTQHTAYRWATGEEILADSAVHFNTRVYFGEPLPR